MKYDSIRRGVAVCFAALILVTAPAHSDAPNYPPNTVNVSVPVVPVVHAAAYVASNAVGGLQTVPFFRTAAQPSGVIDAIGLMSKGGSTVGKTIYIFDTLPAATTCSDQVAFALAAVDVPKLATQPFTLTPALPQGSTSSFAQLVQSVSVKNQDAAQTTNLYVCIVENGGETLSSTSDIVVKISGALD